jgi:hypothetical protein
MSVGEIPVLVNRKTGAELRWLVRYGTSTVDLREEESRDTARIPARGTPWNDSMMFR